MRYLLVLFVAFQASAVFSQTPVKETPKTAVKGVMVERAAVVQGLYKAPAFDNKTKTPGVDGKFNFAPDSTFTYTRKTMTATIVTHGTYSTESTLVELVPAKTGANWPDFWQKPVVLTVNADGDLDLNGLAFKPSLIGRDFTPGFYRCATAPAIHYFFDRKGGYKYTGLGYVSTGEYWVTKEPGATPADDKVFLTLNILRVDGKRVNYHQRIDIVDGGFVLERKFKYRHVDSVAAPESKTPHN